MRGLARLMSCPDYRVLRTLLGQGSLIVGGAYGALVSPIRVGDVGDDRARKGPCLAKDVKTHDFLCTHYNWNGIFK